MYSVALQVEIVCCAYYHLLGQQIFVLQKVDVAFTLLRGGGYIATNTLNLRRNVVARHVARKCCPCYQQLQLMCIDPFFKRCIVFYV